MQPGDVIGPGVGNDAPKNESDQPKPAEEVSVNLRQTETEEKPQQSAPEQFFTPQAPDSSPQSTHEAEASWQYTDDQTMDTPISSVSSLEWTASEFIDHEKNHSWFLGLGLLAILAAIAIYFVSRDIVTSVIIVIVAALFGIMAARKPRVLNYAIGEMGIKIGDKQFRYDDFRSFSVVDEGAINSVQLISHKRFMPPISLYFPPEYEDQIVTTIGSYLPHEDGGNDPIDRLMRRVRF